MGTIIWGYFGHFSLKLNKITNMNPGGELKQLNYVAEYKESPLQIVNDHF